MINFRTRAMLQVSAAFALMGIAMLYQNFSYPANRVQSVNDGARLDHAKELLGHSVFQNKKAVHSMKGKQLSRSITRTLLDRLPAAYKQKSSLLAQTIIEEADFYEMDPVLVLAMMQTESKFNPLAVGTHGEIGLLQVRPETAEWISKRESIDWRGAETLKDPVRNVRIGLAYVNFLRQSFSGSAGKYLSAYNMGAHKVRQLTAASYQPREYSSKVMKSYAELYSELLIARDHQVEQL